MAADLDRFDRMLLGVAPASPTRATFRTAATTTARSFLARATEPRYTAPENEPTVITSSRGPRFVDYTACSLCGFPRVGIEFHGVLLKGGKVHTLTAHTAGMGRVDTKQPRCLGAGMRIEFVDGNWRGVKP